MTNCRVGLSEALSRGTRGLLCASGTVRRKIQLEIEKSLVVISLLVLFSPLHDSAGRLGLNLKVN